MSGDVEPSGALAAYPKYSPTPWLPTSCLGELIKQLNTDRRYLSRWEQYYGDGRSLETAAASKRKRKEKRTRNKFKYIFSHSLFV
jgi:hypothetical protein